MSHNGHVWCCSCCGGRHDLDEIYCPVMMKRWSSLRSSVGLERFPPKEEAVGSSPAGETSKEQL